MKIFLTVGKKEFNIPAWLFWPWLLLGAYSGVKYLIHDVAWIIERIG